MSSLYPSPDLSADSTIASYNVDHGLSFLNDAWNGSIVIGEPFQLRWNQSLAGAAAMELGVYRDERIEGRVLMYALVANLTGLMGDMMCTWTPPQSLDQDSLYSIWLRANIDDGDIIWATSPPWHPSPHLVSHQPLTTGPPSSPDADQSSADKPSPQNPLAMPVGIPLGVLLGIYFACLTTCLMYRRRRKRRGDEERRVLVAAPGDAAGGRCQSICSVTAVPPADPGRYQSVSSVSTAETYTDPADAGPDAMRKLPDGW